MGLGVKLRQQKDQARDILYMDVWVRDLLPNTSYDLRRAVGSPPGWRLLDARSGCRWVQGTTPQRISHRRYGDRSRRAVASRARDCPPSGIQLRVIQTGFQQCPLQSGLLPVAHY